jgi:uncharacterized protein (UPF0332 family)
MKEITLSDIIDKSFDCLEDAREALSRSRSNVALNRSYYAMFHAIQALFFVEGIAAKSHTGAHNAFHKEYILTNLLPRSTGKSLKVVFEKRQFSDYEYDGVSNAEASQAVTDADAFVTAIMQFLKENNHLK